MGSRLHNLRNSATFIVLAFALSIIATYFRAATGQASLVAAVMWGPAVAAIITKLAHDSLRGIGWDWGESSYQALSCSSLSCMPDLPTELCGLPASAPSTKPSTGVWQWALSSSR